MAERLTSAALKAVRIRAELSAKAIKKLTAPKVTFADSFLFIVLVYSHMNLTKFLEFQDPAKPKVKKRKERSEDKVAQTEIKARAEKEAAKKAKTTA